MIIFLNAISECDKRGFIQETVELAKKNGQDIKVISIGDMIMHQLKTDLGATFIPENVLNVDEEFRALATKHIIQGLKKQIKKHKNVIISGHATFYWKKNFTNAFNWEYLKDINPDMFITLIDNTDSLKNNFDKSKQFADQQMTRNEILAWQNVEVNTIIGWSQLTKRPHYILPRKESKGLLYKIMFKPDVELVYASFPMSNIKTDADRKRIDDFVNKLGDYFAVITPRAIELSKEFNDAEAAQTVLRDLRWFTGKAKKVIVYYLPNLVFSAGVMTEINHAFQTSKEILMISPKAFYGPFEKHLITKMFNSEDEFFAYINKKGYKKISIKN